MSIYSARQRQHRSQLLQARAHGMRATPSPAEARLWQSLRGSKLGVPFRRQVVLGQRYIVDFLAPAQCLIVEVDGAQHLATQVADARRDRVLARLGYRTLRVSAVEVHQELESVVERIRAELGR